jgi:putative ABC transport system permease protein
MMTRTELGMVFRLLRYDAGRQRKRMALTILAITWGTITLVVLLSFGEGITREVTKGARSMGEGIGVVWGGATTKAFEGLPSGRRIMLDAEDLDFVKARVPEIRLLSAEYEHYGVPITAGRKTLTPRVQGVEPAYGEMRKYFPQAGGRFLDERDQVGRRRVVFLGNELAEDLFGKGTSPVGQQLLINQSPFLVVGVLEKKIQTDMYSGPDSKHLTIPSSTFLSMFGEPYREGSPIGPRHVGNIVYLPTRPELSETAKSSLYHVLGSRHHFDPADLPALRVWDTRESQRITTNICVGIQIFLGIIGALTMMISGMGVANVMYALVKERTRDIGLQMALGAKVRQVMLPFVAEALVMTVMGGLLGTLVSLAIVSGVNSLHFDSDALSFLTQPTFSPGVAMATSMIIGGVGLLAGYLPARRAASVEPAVSLRYE